jgi:hypothetical protein
LEKAEEVLGLPPPTRDWATLAEQSGEEPFESIPCLEPQTSSAADLPADGRTF